jgi:hypothetical protein
VRPSLDLLALDDDASAFGLQGGPSTCLAFPFIHEPGARLALAFDRSKCGIRPPAPRPLCNRQVNLSLCAATSIRAARLASNSYD